MCVCVCVFVCGVSMCVRARACACLIKSKIHLYTDGPKGKQAMLSLYSDTLQVIKREPCNSSSSGDDSGGADTTTSSSCSSSNTSSSRPSITIIAIFPDKWMQKGDTTSISCPELWSIDAHFARLRNSSIIPFLPLPPPPPSPSHPSCLVQQRCSAQLILSATTDLRRNRKRKFDQGQQRATRTFIDPSRRAGNLAGLRTNCAVSLLWSGEGVKTVKLTVCRAVRKRPRVKRWSLPAGRSEVKNALQGSQSSFGVKTVSFGVIVIMCSIT